MTDPKRLQQLHLIATLCRDRDLATLSAALAARQRSQALLAELDKGGPAQELNLVAALQAEERFGLWKTNRRRHLNQQLAKDTAAWLVAQDQARLSFGKAAVLSKLLKP